MPYNYICRACLRAITRSKVPIHNVLNTSTTTRRFASSVAAASTSPQPSTLQTQLTKPQPKVHPYANPKSTTMRLAQQLDKFGVTETYAAYGSTEKMSKECIRQADYSIPAAITGNRDAIPKTAEGEELGVALEGSEKEWWYDELALTPTFNTWAQITFLHMYILTARLRLFPPAHAPTWHQHLLDHFFYAAEHRMVTLHGLVAKGIRHRYLKDLYSQWRGSLASYDEGLVRGDAVLAGAVWRNIFKAQELEGDVPVRVAMVVGYMRRCVRELEGMSDAEIAGAEVVFKSAGDERKLVEQLGGLAVAENTGKNVQDIATGKSL